MSTRVMLAGATCWYPRGLTYICIQPLILFLNTKHYIPHHVKMIQHHTKTTFVLALENPMKNTLNVT